MQLYNNYLNSTLAIWAEIAAATLGCWNQDDIMTSNKNGHETEERNMMKLGYTLFYVSDVEATLEFFETAFGLERKFLNVEGDKGYGELNTGGTTLGFVSYAQARSVGIDFIEPKSDGPAHAVEIGFVTDKVAAAYETAVQNGATPVAPPAEKPWGQTVSYVRDPNGILVEICSEVTPP